MMPDLTPVFIRYKTLVASVDAMFSNVAARYAGCVTCHRGCADCCHALFDLSLIEALYLNMRFKESFPYSPRRSAILAAAAQTDRKLAVLKKSYFRSMRNSREQATDQDAEKIVHNVLEQAAHDRVRCPLLGADNTCLMYDDRPITCRIYGIPTAIGRKGHVCGLSGFKAGTSYPTVYLDKIQSQLAELSLNIQNLIASRFTELHTVYVPVSMALLINYDETYMGVDPAPDPGKEF